MRNYISPIIHARLPGFLASDYPSFLKFIKHYYDFLESNGNPLEILENFRERLEVNNEVDLYIDKIVAELGFDVSRPYIIPKKELVIHLRDFYLSRGSENSFKFLFKVLFNDSVQIEYPRDRLFTLSGATYTGNFYVFTTAVDEDTPEFQKLIDAIRDLNITIRGVSSNIVSGVEDIQIVVSKNKHFLKIQIYSALKNYLPYEGVIIEVASDPSIHIREYIMNTLSIQVEQGGKGYRVGDRITSSGCGINGVATVASLATGSIQALSIVSPGSGYAVGDRVVTQNTVKGHSFSAVVNSVGTLADPPVGAIRHIKILSPGYDYEAVPDIAVISSTGTGAVLDADSDQIGKIRSIEIIEPFVDAIDLSSVTYSIESDEGTGAVLVPEAKTVYTERSSFKNMKGALEVNCIILDSYYFQQFSYLLRSSVARSEYDPIVDEMVHPSGFVRFAVLELYSASNLGAIEEWSNGSEWLTSRISIGNRIKIMEIDSTFSVIPTTSFNPVIKVRDISNPTQVIVNPINNLEWFKESIDESLETNYPVSNSVWGSANLEYIHNNSNLMDRALDVEIDQHPS